MVTKRYHLAFFYLFVRQDGDPEQPGQGPGGEQDEAAEQAGSQVIMMVMMTMMIVTRLVILLLNHAKLFHYYMF